MHHDAKYLFGQQSRHLVDTLYLSPLLFSERPYHRLVKDDKLVCDQLNNPVNDCEKAKDLLMDEIGRWNQLSRNQKKIFSSLLCDKEEFKGFFMMVEAPDKMSLSKTVQLIKEEYEGRICGHADLAPLIQEHPCALAYALALVNTTDHRSITPAWVLYNFPEVEHIIELLNAIKAKNQGLFSNFSEMSLKEVEEALLFLSQIGALKLEGGFLVLYNAMDIQRLKDNRLRYKQEEYRMLNEFYKQKMQQIHIVGEYANLMVKNYQEALQYVQDYFLMDYQRFIAKYFKGEEAKGYKVTNAKVRFIVAWKPKDAPKDEKESAIPLIDLTMTRKI